MDIQWFLIDDIRPYERNPRKNSKAVDKVADSLKTYGWQQVIVVDTEHTIIAGHTRWLAAKKLKMEKVPVFVARNLTSEQVKTYRIADNRLSEEAEWDSDLLRQELDSLKELDVDLSLTAFSEIELTKLLGTLAEPDAESSDWLTPQNIVVSQPSDIWELGHHRLMCGDATSSTDLARLMNGVKADLVFTDPPYNVDYLQARGAFKGRRIQNDNMNPEAYLQFLEVAFASAMIVVKPEASWYVCHASQFQDLVKQALEANNLQIRSQLIWTKNHFVLNRGRYKTQHEPIFYAYRKGQVDAWYGDRGQSTLWPFDKPLSSDLHPTMKPWALIQKALQNSSLTGDRVLDMFGGAGSTLIAAEHTHRQAYLVEIMPQYVDVILRRWEKHTGKAAVLSGTDRTFTDCVSARQGIDHGASGS
jgi:DNA modification methylase